MEKKNLFHVVCFTIRQRFNQGEVYSPVLNVRLFSTGQRLIRQGTYSRGVYFLVHGSVVLSQSKIGHEIESIELKDIPLTQGIFGERSILFDQKAICTVTANEHVLTLFIQKDDFRELLDLHPQLLRNCLDHISDYSQSNDDCIALVFELQKKLLHSISS